MRLVAVVLTVFLHGHGQHLIDHRNDLSPIARPATTAVL